MFLPHAALVIDDDGSSTVFGPNDSATRRVK